VADHAELLREGLRWLPGSHLTVEWWVDDVPGGPVDLAALSDALAGMDQISGHDVDLGWAMRLSRLRLDRPLPPARLVLDGLPASDEDRWNFRRLLGSSHMRMVPWEVPF
jgi:hypothetical protein